MPGDALDASLRQHGVPPLDEALLTLGWLAEALDRAAGEGIHHGSLHPRDVLVAEGGEARLIDLGVAAALERAGLRAPVRRPYGAPERREGRSWGGPADIFALGAIAYELVTGRRVAGAGSPTLAIDGMTGLDQTGLAEVLGRALAVDPSARFASASDLVDVLRPILARARRVSLARRRSRNVAAEGVVPLPLEAEAPPASGPEAHADLPLTIVDERRPLEDLMRDPPPPGSGARSPRPMRSGADDLGSAAASESGALQSATWQAPPDLGPGRGRVTPLLVAVLVGLAAGFGLGYWTAWRAAERAQARTVAAMAPAASTVGGATGQTRVEEPVVRGERAAEPTPRSPATAPSRPATAPSPPARPAPSPAPERARPRREAGAAGKLLVKSTPSGARVRVNGRVRGKTPLILRDMPLRVMTVQVDQPGFKANEQRVALSAARPTATVDARLVAEAPEVIAGTTTGSLVVESRPSGARVFVDNQEVGTSPLSMPEVAPGHHRVRLELNGFNPWVTMAEIKLGARTRVSASLEQGPPR